MTLEELYAGLKSLGLPVAYNEFVVTSNSSAPPPPFITYQLAYNSDLSADNINYVDIANYQIELYTARKSPGVETLVQNKLKDLGLSYSKLETWLTEEKLYQILYQVQLIGG